MNSKKGPTLLFIVVLLFLFIIIQSTIGYIWYNNKCNDDNISDDVIVSIIKKNYEKLYDLSDERIQSTYSRKEFSLIFEIINNKNKCLSFSKSRVNSSDIFHIFIMNCNKNEILCKISLSGGWIEKWKITNIVLNDTKQNNVKLD